MKKFLALAVCMVFLLPGLAKADNLVLGGNYTPNIFLLDGSTQLTEGGGDIWPSYLNGQSLAYVYCVNIGRVVYIPGTYDNTGVTSNGTIFGAALNNADKVAWLLSHYGIASNGDQAYALQAAIWHEIVPTITIDSTKALANQVNLYNSMLSALTLAYTLGESGDVTMFDWLSPQISGDNTLYQGLVAPKVPIPAAVWLLGSGLLGLVGIRRRFMK